MDRVDVLLAAIAVAVLFAMLIPALYLWWPSRASAERRADIASSLLTGVAVGLGLFVVQLLYEVRLDRVEDRQARALRHQGLQLAIAQSKTLPGVVVENADLRGFYLRGKNLVDSSFAGSDLRGAILDESVLARANFNDTRIGGARFGEANLDNAWFIEAKGRDVFFASACLRGAQLIDAELPDATFVGARLDGSDLTRADLTDANFADASLVDVDLSGADLSRAQLDVAAVFARVHYDGDTKWPDGFDPRARSSQGASARPASECVPEPVE